MENKNKVLIFALENYAFFSSFFTMAKGLNIKNSPPPHPPPSTLIWSLRDHCSLLPFVRGIKGECDWEEWGGGDLNPTSVHKY